MIFNNINCIKKILFSIFCGLLFVGICQAASIEELNKTAFGFLSKNQNQEAILIYDQILLIDPTNTTALLYEGAAYRNLGKYNESLQFFDRALSIDPSFKRAWRNRASTLNSMGRNLEALQDADKALQLDPNYEGGFVEKSQALLSLKRIDEASQNIDLALALDPNDTYALDIKAGILFLQGKDQDAIKILNNSIIIDPNNLGSWQLKCLIYLHLNQYSDVLVASTRMINLDPNDSDAMEYQAIALLNLGRNEEAINVSENALRLDPNNIRALVCKAGALGNLGRNEEAINVSENVLRFDPTNVDALSIKANALNNLGRYDDAIKYYDAALKISPNQAIIWKNKGKSLFANKKYPEAIQALDEAIKLNPGDNEAINFRNQAAQNIPNYTILLFFIFLISCIVAIFLVATGKSKQLLEKYRKYKENNRKNQFAANKTKIQDHIDSTSKYVQSLKNCPNSGEVNKLISQSYSYLEYGNLKAAIEHIKKAEKLANSTIDSILAEARNITLQAESNYNQRKYSDALDLWKQSLSIYKNADTIAQNTNDKELIKKIKEVREEILENIKKSEIVIDRQYLSEFVKNGNQKIISAKELFDDKKFDDAKRNYESARETFSHALKISDKRNFTDNQVEIKEAIKRINSSIESVMLGKSHALIDEGDTSFQNRKFAAAENYYSLAIRLLEENPMNRAEADFIHKAAKKGQIAAQFEQGKEKMRNADQLYAKEQYYEAKEQYKSAREYIEKLSEEASRYQFLTLHSALSQLSKRCTENMNVATSAMMKVGGVEHAIISVDHIEEAQAEFKLPVKSKQFLDDHAIPGKTTLNNLPSELTDIYPEWTYLGKGGFARVFKGKKKDGAFVAVKIPLTMDASTGKTFIAEMQNWKKLSHNNIVKLYDFNIMPIPYLEEELCDGSLADLKKPFKTEEAAWILFNICEGLKLAHSQKIIHRDLKPQNILLKNGIPKLSDWGLSRIITESTTTTSTSFTPYYAAPEQINNGVKDERTDIWQLGIILYELITGELPFNGDTIVEIGMNIATKDPKLPSEINSDAKVLDFVVMNCLQKEPAKRYQSVIELQKALAQFLRITYSESLKMTETKHDYTRSAYYCGKLVMCNLQTGNISESYKYLQDLVHNTKGDVKVEIQELSNQIEIRMDMGLTEIPDELIQKAEFIIHKVNFGF